MLRHHFTAPFGHKKPAFLSREQNATWNKDDEKNSKQQIQFLSAFKPSCHCFSRWLLHKRGSRVNHYKLVSAYNANQIVFFFYCHYKGRSEMRHGCWDFHDAIAGFQINDKVHCVFISVFFLSSLHSPVLDSLSLSQHSFLCSPNKACLMLLFVSSSSFTGLNLITCAHVQPSYQKWSLWSV